MTKETLHTCEAFTVFEYLKALYKEVGEFKKTARKEIGAAPILAPLSWPSTLRMFAKQLCNLANEIEASREKDAYIFDADCIDAIEAAKGAGVPDGDLDARVWQELHRVYGG